jgi:hypothetical protein
MIRAHRWMRARTVVIYFFSLGCVPGAAAAGCVVGAVEVAGAVAGSPVGGSMRTVGGTAPAGAAVAGVAGLGVAAAGGAGVVFGAGAESLWLTSSISKMRSERGGMVGG